MHNENRRRFLRNAGAALVGMTALRPLNGESVRGPLETDGMQEAVNSAAQRRMRGLMVDAARLPESPDYYRRVIEFCAEWELNTLQFRITDDQGTALRFASVPDLITHPDALTADEMKRLVEFATSHGVEVIPEVESFGHTGFITRSPKYAHLLDADPHGSKEFTGVIPVLPETRELFDRLYREVAAVFPSAYLHAGCDEVDWGGSDVSRKALQAKSRAQIWAEYLNSLQRSAEGLGKQLIVWGDLVLHKEPQVISQLDQKIIIMDWNYWDTRATGFRDALMEIEKSGHRGIGAPALISYRWGPRAGSEQLRNIDAFTEAYSGADDAGSLGVILTNWVPTRWVQNSLWDGFAYAAVAFNEGPEKARLTGFRRFVERHYGAEWNEVWAEAIDLIYDAAPGYGERTTITPMGLHLSTPWSSDAQLAAVLKDRSPRINPFVRVRSLLVQLESGVLKNRGDFQAFVLSVECLKHLFWRDGMVMEHALKKPVDAAGTKLLIEAIADGDRELAEKLSKDWDGGRSPESAAKRELVYDLRPKDQLLYQWREAAAYSSSLAQRPDRFSQLLQGGA